MRQKIVTCFVDPSSLRPFACKPFFISGTGLGSCSTVFITMGDCKDAHVVQARAKLLAPVSLLFWMLSTGGSRSSDEGVNGRV
jgi:hypothetical protein